MTPGHRPSLSLPVSILPWNSDCKPLMLAPMQGLTNRGLRRLFIDLVRPDVVCTEYVQVKSGSRNPISKNDRLEVRDTADKVPLIVQLIGGDPKALCRAAELVQVMGARHLNINLGCPYGRMGKKGAGGALLQDPVALAKMLQALRSCIAGSLSLKVRAGYNHPSELFSLLALFEDCGIDFLIVHARTVTQKYSGIADHTVTSEVVRKTSLPVIANGDITTTALGLRVFEETGAAGLMLGRGAISDPYLFQRLREKHVAVSALEERRAELQGYLLAIAQVYPRLFCGEQQALAKLKEILAFIHDPDLRVEVRQLKKTRNLDRFTTILENFSGS